MPETVAAFAAAAATSAGASAAAAATVGSIASATAVIATNLAISYGINALLTPASPSPNQGRNVSTEGGVRAHPVAYGRGLVSGHAVAEHGWAKKGDKLKFYTRVFALAGHEFDAIEGWLIDGSPYTPNAAGFIIDRPYFAKNTSFLQVHHSLGRRDETVHVKFQEQTRPRDSSSGNIDFAAPVWWRDTDRLQGRPWQAFIGEYDDAAFPGGQFPSVQAVWRFKKVYDPRLDSTQDGGVGSQRADDPSTWTWSDNWALCCTDYWRSEYGPMRDTVVDFAGRIMPTSSVDWASVIAAANASDELVPDGKGGQEKRYRLWAYMPDSNNPRSNFDMMVVHGAGWYSEHAGQLKLWAGVYHPPALDAPTIEVGWETGPVMVERMKSLLSRFNGLRGEWLDPDQSWRAVAYPEVTDADALARDKDRKRFQPMNLFYSPSVGQAIRVASIAIRRTLYQRMITLPTDRLGLLLEPGHTVSVDLPERRISGAVFKVTSWSFQFGGPEADRCDIVLEEENAAIYDLPAIIAGEAVTDVPASPGFGATLDNRLNAPSAIDSVMVSINNGYNVSWTPLDASELVARYDIYAKSGAPLADPQSADVSGQLAAGAVGGSAVVAGLDQSLDWTFYVRAVDTAGVPGPFTASPTALSSSGA
ncbi:MAG: hypothetical protein AAFY22_13165 [Pseudomonadota bacterium]